MMKRNLWKILIANALGFATVSMLALSACQPAEPQGSTPETPPAPWEDWSGEEPTHALDYEVYPLNKTTDAQTAMVVPVIAKKTGVYELGFKVKLESGTNVEISVVNDEYPEMSTGATAYLSKKDADGYLAYEYYAYLEEGLNSVSVTPSVKTTFEAMRFGLQQETSAVVYFDKTTGWWNGGTGVHASRLVQASEGPYTVTSKVTVEEDGFYHFSSFSSGLNDGEMEVTFTDENGLALSLNAFWFERDNAIRNHDDWRYIWWTDGLYRAPEKIADKFNFEADDSYFLTAGEYTVSATGIRMTPTSQVMFGDGIFLSAVDRTCAHNYTKVSDQPVTCTVNGGDVMECSLCKHRKLENVVASGHTYEGQAFSVGTQLTCTRCGIIEKNLGEQAPQQVEPKPNPAEDPWYAGLKGCFRGNEYSYYNSTKFEITAPKAGVYKVYFDYTGTGTETTVLLNATTHAENANALEGEDGITSIVSLNTLSADKGVLSYAEGCDGYSSSYLSVYLFEGKNTLDWHNYLSNSLTLNHVMLVYDGGGDAFSMTTSEWNYEDRSNHQDFGGRKNVGGTPVYTDGLGFFLNIVIAPSYYGASAGVAYSTGKLKIDKSGWYDLSFFASALNATGELYLTLQKGETKIEMRSSGLPNDDETRIGYNEKTIHMLHSRNLYVYTGTTTAQLQDRSKRQKDYAAGGTKGDHRVWLDEGEYDLTVLSPGDPSSSICGEVFFGNGIFATYLGNER